MSTTALEKIDDEARAALEAAGGRFLRQLEVMREGDEAPIEISPLDPDAALALRKRGDAFLQELEQQRPRKTWRRSWIAAAALVAMAFALLQLSSPPPLVVNKAEPPAEVGGAEDGVVGVGAVEGAAAIPEPGTGVLTLMGGVMFVMRRKR